MRSANINQNEWPISNLGSVVRFISGGTPKKDEERYWNGSIPWVSSGEMSKGRIYNTQLSVTEDGVRNGTKLAPKNTIFVVVRGMSLAKEFRVSLAMRKMTFNQDVKAIYPSRAIDPIFLFYYLKSQSNPIRDSASEAAHGTKKLDMPVLEQWPVPLPPLPAQQKIAAILSAYDDLIENNKRRIALLENMAEEIYREWFVRFRFPGYQTAKFEKGIPKEWKLVPYTEAVNINPTELLDKEEEKPYVGMEALSTNSMYFEYSEKRKGNSGSKFRNGDTLFPRITPCLENGKRGFVSTLKDGEVGVGSTEFIIMREKLLTPEYIYLLCCFEPFRTHAEISMVGASGRQRVAQNCFTFFLVPVPSVEILEKFTDTVRPMFESIRILSRMNSYLEKTRDNLLPRLISGKLSVENLDIQFPPSMLTTAEAE